MIEVIASSLLAFLERELIKHEPEIEAAIIDQLGKLSEVLMAFVNSKLNPAPADAPVAALPDETPQN